MRPGIFVAAMIGLWLAGEAPSQAQPVEVFLDAARQYNPALSASRLQVDAAREDRGETLSSLAPSLNVSAFYLRNQVSAEIDVPAAPGSPPERLTIIPSNQWQVDLTVRVPLIDVPAWMRAGAQATAVTAAQHDEAVAEQDVALAVVQSWAGLAAARAIAEATARAVDASEELVRVNEVRVQQGASTEIDLSRAQAELAERQRLFAQASATASVQAIVLSRLTGLVPGTIVLPPMEEIPEEAPLSAWVDRAALLPRVKAARTRTEAFQKQANAAGAQLWPRLEARGTQTFTNATGFADAPSFWQAMLVVTAPLEARSIAQARRLDVEAERLHALAGSALDDGVQRISDAWYAVQRLTAQVASAREQLHAAQVAERLIEARYRAGAANSLEVREARREAILVESTLLRDVSELFAARAALRLTAGLPWNAAGPGTP